MANTKFEIKETIGVLSESAKGWTKELSLVSWNDKDPKVPHSQISRLDHPKIGEGSNAYQRGTGEVKGFSGWDKSANHT
jgi:hypothetical protein